MDVTDSGTVVIADSTKGLIGIDADTGRSLWTNTWLEGAELPYVVQGHGNLAIVADRTDLGETDGQVSGLDTTTGATLWRHPVADASSRYLTGGDVVIDVSERLVLTRSRSTGDELWRFEGSGIGVVSMPDDGLVMIHDRGKFRGPGKPDTSTVHLLDVGTGAVEWSTRLDAYRVSDAISVHGSLVLGLAKDDQPVGGGENGPVEKGAVVALDRSDGSVLWRTEVRDAVTSPPAMVDGHLIVTSADVPLFCD